MPLFLWCPGLVPPGSDDVYARHIDILPTILDALGEGKPAELTGQSLLSANRKEAPEGSYFEALSAAFNRGWAPLRGLASQRRQVHRPSDSRALRPADRPRGGEEPRAGGARRAPPAAQAPARAAGGAARARHGRLRGGREAEEPRLPDGIGRDEGDLRPGRRSQDADRGGPDAPPRHGPVRGRAVPTRRSRS